MTTYPTFRLGAFALPVPSTVASAAKVVLQSKLFPDISITQPVPAGASEIQVTCEAGGFWDIQWDKADGSPAGADTLVFVKGVSEATKTRIRNQQNEIDTNPTGINAGTTPDGRNFEGATASQMETRLRALEFEAALQTNPAAWNRTARRISTLVI